MSATEPTDAPPVPAGDKQALAALLRVIGPDMERVQAVLAEITRSPAPYVQELVDHVRGFGGKKLRPALVILAGRAVDAEQVGEVHARVGAIVELIHSATLVHDDILDGALIRRMRPTLHSLEGEEISVLLGDFLLASAYAEAAALEDNLASRYLSKVTRIVCQGEMLQIHNRGNLDLSLDSYLEIIEKKTAVLYAASCECGARYAGGEPAAVSALHDYGMSLGMAFQIVDDVLDLTGDEAVVGKSLGTDLARCKLTLPLIHFLQTGPAEQVAHVRDALSSGRGAEEAAMIRAAVLDNGSVEHAMEDARSRIRGAVDGLGALPPSEGRDLLTALAEYTLVRRR
jgi:octaprenyl-diphosphate synthase